MYSANVKNSKEFKLYHKFLNNFNLGRENDIGLQECLVEFWGEFFNNVIYSYIYSKVAISQTIIINLKFITMFLKPS